MRGRHKKTGYGLLGNMLDNRIFDVASVAIACKCSDHADRVVGMLQKLESLIGGYDRLVGKVSAFER